MARTVQINRICIKRCLGLDIDKSTRPLIIYDKNLTYNVTLPIDRSAEWILSPVYVSWTLISNILFVIKALGLGKG